MKRTARQIDVNSIGHRNFAVTVDGLLWCYAICEPRGMHGSSYTFQYSSDDEPIHEPAKRGSPVVVWSDKHWLSSQGFHGSGGMAKHRAVFEGKYKTIQERIAETAARLIKKKLIVSPDERARQREARADEARRRREEFEVASHKRLNDKAKEIVKKFATGETVVYRQDQDQLRKLIVEAMEWARSNT